MGDDTACFPGCACLRCVGVVKPGTQVAVPNQAVHLGADGICIHGQSVCAADQPFYIGMDLASGPDKTAYFSYGRQPLERSGRPWPPPAAEIPVTDEMRRAGSVASGFAPDHVQAGPMAVAIYRAMAALAPVELVSEGEQQAVRQRERARQENQALGKLYCEATERNVYLEAVVANMPTADSVKEMLDGKDAEIALLRQALAMKDARIGELKSVLASTPVAFEDPDAKPEPEINPFRNFGHDPRRMGPL